MEEVTIAKVDYDELVREAKEYRTTKAMLEDIMADKCESCAMFGQFDVPQNQKEPPNERPQ